MSMVCAVIARKGWRKVIDVRFLQFNLPWTVPYSEEFAGARTAIPHIDGVHAAMHAAKSVGKLCAAFEKADHGEIVDEKEVRKGAAELMIVALRFANLYNFLLDEEVMDRLEEKNGIGIWEEWHRLERLAAE